MEISLKIRGSAREGSVPLPDSLAIDSSGAPIDPSSTITEGSLVATQTPLKVENIIQLESFKFPPLGSPTLAYGEWTRTLKMKLREMGANEYSLYNWPAPLVEMVLKIPLEEVVYFDKHYEAQERKEVVLPEISEWAVPDPDGILVGTEVETVVESPALRPFEYLYQIMGDVFNRYPRFKALFHREMPVRVMRDKLYKIYLGMWMGRKLVSILKSKVIIPKSQNEFKTIHTLSDFFVTANKFEPRLKWQALTSLFTTFNEQLYVKHTSGPKTTEEVLKNANNVRSEVRSIGHLNGLDKGIAQQYLYFSAIQAMKDKLSKVCDMKKYLTQLNLNKYGSLHRSPPLTYEVTCKIINSMIDYAENHRPAIDPPLSRTSSTKTPQATMPPSKAPSAEPLPAAHEPTKLAPNYPSSLPHSRSLPRLDDKQKAELRNKILADALTPAEEEIVQAYKFVFKYPLMALQRRKEAEDDLRREYEDRAREKEKTSRKELKAEAKEAEVNRQAKPKEEANHKLQETTRNEAQPSNNKASKEEADRKMLEQAEAKKEASRRSLDKKLKEVQEKHRKALESKAKAASSAEEIPPTTNSTTNITTIATNNQIRSTVPLPTTNANSRSTASLQASTGPQNPFNYNTSISTWTPESQQGRPMPPPVTEPDNQRPSLNTASPRSIQPAYVSPSVYPPPSEQTIRNSSIPSPQTPALTPLSTPSIDPRTSNHQTNTVERTLPPVRPFDSSSLQQAYQSPPTNVPSAAPLPPPSTSQPISNLSIPTSLPPSQPPRISAQPAISFQPAFQVLDSQNSAEPNSRKRRAESDDPSDQTLTSPAPSRIVRPTKRILTDF